MMVFDIHIIMIVFINILLTNILKFFWWENLQQIPGLFQTVKNGPCVILSLCNKLIFKSLQKLQVKKVVLVQSLFSNNSLHSHSILSHCIVKIKLIGNLLVILPGPIFSYCTFHKSTQRWKDIYRRVDVPIMQLSI